MHEIYEFIISLSHTAIKFDDWVSTIKSDMLNMRLKNCDYGCFAMLIREVAFKSKEIGNHNYLEVPESIEDLGLCDIYMQRTKPSIIQFYALPDRDYKYLIKPVLGYLFDKIHHVELSVDDNTIFDAKGDVIKPSNILNIEIIDDDV